MGTEFVNSDEKRCTGGVAEKGMEAAKKMEAPNF